MENKAKSLLEMIGIVKEDKSDDYKDKENKDLVPMNEPEEKEDDFSDLNIKDGDGDKEDKKKDIDYKKLFKDNPNPPDTKIHDLADKLGVEHSDLESKIYALLTTYLKIGKHQDVPDDKFDKEQLDAGIEVEKEHTDDPEVAKLIAKDHLTEFPMYYVKLKEMEDALKKEKSDKEEPKKDDKEEKDEDDI